MTESLPEGTDGECQIALACSLSQVLFTLTFVSGRAAGVKRFTDQISGRLHRHFLG